MRIYGMVCNSPDCDIPKWSLNTGDRRKFAENIGKENTKKICRTIKIQNKWKKGLI